MATRKAKQLNTLTIIAILAVGIIALSVFSDSTGFAPFGSKFDKGHGSKSPFCGSSGPIPQLCLPDLVVTKIYWTWRDPNPDPVAIIISPEPYYYTFKIEVKNRGSALANNFKVELVDKTHNNRWIGSCSILGLNPGQTKTCKIFYNLPDLYASEPNPKVKGLNFIDPFNVKISADSENRINELNEGNNVWNEDAVGCAPWSQPIFCGNGVCDSNPEYHNCKPDKLVEDFQTCRQDCGFCGDNLCDLVEQEGEPKECRQDCGFCGDGWCYGGDVETIDTCPSECFICGDSICGTGENCLVDCGGCGDNICDPGLNESADNCREDCY